MSRIRRSMCVALVLCAPAVALAQGDVEQEQPDSKFYIMDDVDIFADGRPSPGVIISADHGADFDSLVRVERSFLSEIRDAAHAPSLQ